MRISNQNQRVTAIVSAAVEVPNERGIELLYDGAQIRRLITHSLGNRYFVYQIDLPPPVVEQRYSLRFQPVRTLYGQQIPADVTSYDGCNLRLTFTGTGDLPQALQLSVDGEHFRGQLTISQTLERTLTNPSASLTVADGPNRSGGTCAAGPLAVALRPLDRTTHSLIGEVTVSSGRWFLVQVAPQYMGARLASDMVSQSFERRRRLFQALLGAADRAYRGHRQSLVAGDIVRISRTQSDPKPLSDLALTPGPRRRQPADELSLPAETIADLADFERDRPAVEPADAMDAVREYAELHGPAGSGQPSAVLVIAATMSRSADSACRAWRTEMLRTATERNVAVRAIIAANVPGAEIATALRMPNRPSRGGGLYQCPRNRDEDADASGAANVSVFIYSFVDLVEQAADAEPRIVGMTETVTDLIEEILPR